MNDCDIKCVNPRRLHNDRQEPSHKETAPTPIIPPNTALRDDIERYILRWKFDDLVDMRARDVADQILALIQDNQCACGVCSNPNELEHEVDLMIALKPTPNQQGEKTL